MACGPGPAGTRLTGWSSNPGRPFSTVAVGIGSVFLAGRSLATGRGVRGSAARKPRGRCVRGAWWQDRSTRCRDRRSRSARRGRPPQPAHPPAPADARRGAHHVGCTSCRHDLLGGLPFGPVFDCVLVDAPCSGLGTIRRDPDIRWSRREDDLAGARAAVSAGCSRRPRAASGPGGMLVYATCSSEPEENEAVVERLPRPHAPNSRSKTRAMRARACLQACRRASTSAAACGRCPTGTRSRPSSPRACGGADDGRRTRSSTSASCQYSSAWPWPGIGASGTSATSASCSARAGGDLRRCSPWPPMRVALRAREVAGARAGRARVSARRRRSRWTTAGLTLQVDDGQRVDDRCPPAASPRRIRPPGIVVRRGPWRQGLDERRLRARRSCRGWSASRERTAQARLEPGRARDLGGRGHPLGRLSRRRRRRAGPARRAAAPRGCALLVNRGERAAGYVMPDLIGVDGDAAARRCCAATACASSVVAAAALPRRALGHHPPAVSGGRVPGDAGRAHLAGGQPMSIRIAPSILAADFAALGACIAAAERGGADLDSRRRHGRPLRAEPDHRPARGAIDQAGGDACRSTCT